MEGKTVKCVEVYFELRAHMEGKTVKCVEVHLELRAHMEGKKSSLLVFLS